MAKKIIVTVLAVLACGFVSRSNAGTDVAPGYSAPLPNYNYAPPRPVYYAPPPPPVGFVIYPGYRYYRPGFAVHRFYPRHVYWRSDHHWH